MTEETKANYHIITKQKQLKSYLESIKDETILFIDTEFHREKTYYATLCLIQIATENTLVAIDPLVHNLDLSAFVDFIKQPHITKVFHAGKQDLEIFFKLNNNQAITNVFDTQVAALALGLGDQIGYGNLVKSILNIDLDKSQQVANWQNRPMSEEQLEYAMADVIYLKEIYYKLIKRIIKKDRLDLIKDEHNKLEDNNNLSTDIQTVYQSIKLRDKSPKTMTVLRELAKFREIEAQKSNKFRNSVLRDEFLGYCARLKPKTIEELEIVRGVSKNIISKYGTQIVKIINESLTLPKSELVVIESEANIPIVDTHLKALATFILQLKAKEHEISLKLVADSHDLTYFLASDKFESKLRTGWRWEMFGKDLEKLRNGNLFVGSDGKNVIFKEIETTNEVNLEKGE
jgi:ribonuclease D